MSNDQLRLFIARHGQNLDNVNGILNGHRDLPLTDLGVRQAHDLADGILEAGITFDAVYCSPLSRAKVTAEIVCERLNIVAPIVREGLIERDFGEMTGKPVADIELLCAPDIIKTSMITYFLSPPGAETFPMLLERAQRELAAIRALHSQGSVGIFTHGDFGKMFYAAYYNLPWQPVLTDFHFGNCELLSMSPDSPASESHVIHLPQHNH